MRMYIRHLIFTAINLQLLASCGGGNISNTTSIIYKCDDFTVAGDRLTMNDTVVKAVSPYCLICDKDTSLNWSRLRHTEKYPEYESDQPLIDALYNRAIENIERGDISLSQHTAWATWLAISYLNPEAAADSLNSRIKDGEILSQQHALEWPVSSDRSVWILAAYELQRITGDKKTHEQTETIAASTLRDDTLACRDPRSGLMYGSQTYLLPQPALYPEWMDPTDIYQSPCLGTNVTIAAAAKTTGMTDLSQSISKAVTENMWQPNLGYFSAYLYCYPYPIQLQATDNMAQAIGVVFDVFPADTAQQLISNSPVYSDGIPTLYPMPRIYRNESRESIKPLTQSLWTLAAMKTRNEKAFNLSFGSLIKMNVTDRRANFFASGVAATIFRGFAGMRFEENGISFNPYIPVSTGGYKRIKNFRYRDAAINIFISGTGDSITSFTIDGHQQQRYFLPDSLKGQHTVAIEITKSNKHYRSGTNICAPAYMPMTPEVKWSESRNAVITNYQPEIDYQLVSNGEFQTFIGSSSYRMFATDSYTVVNFLPTLNSIWVGFSQAPYRYCPPGTRKVVDVENNTINLHGVAPGTYMATFTYSATSETAIGEITSADMKERQPVVFLQSKRPNSRSSAVVIDIGRHRTLKIEDKKGTLPKITKAIIIKL